MGTVASGPPVSRRRRIAFTALALTAFVGFSALGAWQVQRRAWKHELLARIDQRVHAAPSDPPPQAAWPGASAARDEYLRVRIEGHWDEVPSTLVLASTRLGTGHWVLSPLRREDGTCLLVNRGFVPDGTAPAAPPPGPASVTGLLRMSEPGGLWLRANQASQDRWFSRDVAAIVERRGLQRCAPWFLDAQPADPAARAEPGAAMTAEPVPGLTVLDLPDNHAIYALTWFSLAALALGGALAFALTPPRPPTGGR